MTEKTIIQIIKKALPERVKRFSGGQYQPAGIPDLLILESIPSNNYWIEIKINRTKLTENQEKFLEKSMSVLLIVDEKKKEIRYKTYNFLYELKSLGDIFKAIQKKYDYELYFKG